MLKATTIFYHNFTNIDLNLDLSESTIQMSFRLNDDNSEIQRVFSGIRKYDDYY